VFLSTKKVALHSQKSSINNLYRSNNSRLTILPSVILGAISLLVIFSFGFYFVKNIDLNLLFGNKSVIQTNALTPEYFVKNDEKNLQIQNVKQQQTVINNEIQATLKINFQNQICELTYSSYKPQNIVLVLETKVQGFWLPTNCFVKNLSALQILKVSSEEEVVLKTTLAGKNLVLDEREKIYLIEYSTGNNQDTLNYLEYQNTLFSPVLKSVDISPLASAFDSQRILEEVFYLDGPCRDSASEAGCNLWKTDKVTGKPVLLREFVGGIGKKSAQELSKGVVFRFAATQDSMPQALNFILYNENNGDLKLVRIGTGQYNTVQEIKIDKKLSPEAFRKYYR